MGDKIISLTFFSPDHIFIVTYFEKIAWNQCKVEWGDMEFAQCEVEWGDGICPIIN